MVDIQFLCAWSLVILNFIGTLILLAIPEEKPGKHFGHIVGYLIITALYYGAGIFHICFGLD